MLNANKLGISPFVKIIWEQNHDLEFFAIARIIHY